MFFGISNIAFVMHGITFDKISSDIAIIIETQVD